MSARLRERFALVRRLRAEGLTKPAIAERLGITVRQVTWAEKTVEERAALGERALESKRIRIAEGREE